MYSPVSYFWIWVKRYNKDVRGGSRFAVQPITGEDSEKGWNLSKLRMNCRIDMLNRRVIHTYAHQAFGERNDWLSKLYILTKVMYV